MNRIELLSIFGYEPIYFEKFGRHINNQWNLEYQGHCDDLTINFVLSFNKCQDLECFDFSKETTMIDIIEDVDDLINEVGDYLSQKPTILVTIYYEGIKLKTIEEIKKYIK